MLAADTSDYLRYPLSSTPVGKCIGYAKLAIIPVPFLTMCSFDFDFYLCCRPPLIMPDTIHRRKIKVL